MTLAQFVIILEEMTKLCGYEYCAGLAKHVLKVANVPVRNVSAFESILCLDFSDKVIHSDNKHAFCEISGVNKGYFVTCAK